ncbi:hypothetical protein DM39_1505 [Burkholderia cenocepacia]|uniref:Uncharacterized protein n=1 Tax=Burkholderia cenocepacia TaxID=95486 RepID=A0AAN0VKX5_9BURK|nr:hypothetical protein DM39_1505 [Burkholderia cenocepacia]
MDTELLCRTVRTPADLRNLPGYIDRVDPKQTALRRIIWPYSFKSEIACSLTNCRTPHKDGVIIELEDGSISNIGNICGADDDKFSTKFSTELLAMAEARRREQMTPRLLDRAGLQKIEADVRAICDDAHKWVRLCTAFESLCSEADRELRRRLTAGENFAITEVSERGEAEISELIASGQARNRSEARYKETVKGTIRGTGVLRLSESGLTSLERRARALLSADPLAADIAELQRLFNETVHLPMEVRDVADACRAGAAFFSADNFELMSDLSLPQRAKSTLRSLTLGTLEEHSKAISRSGVETARNSSAPRVDSKRERAAKKRLVAQLRSAQRMVRR